MGRHPEEVKAIIRRVVALIGKFEHASLQINFGALDPREALSSMRPFAAEEMAEFADAVPAARQALPPARAVANWLRVRASGARPRPAVREAQPSMPAQYVMGSGSLASRVNPGTWPEEGVEARARLGHERVAVGTRWRSGNLADASYRIVSYSLCQTAQCLQSRVTLRPVFVSFPSFSALIPERGDGGAPEAVSFILSRA